MVALGGRGAPPVAGDGCGEDSAGGRAGASLRVVDTAKVVVDEILLRGPCSRGGRVGVDALGHTALVGNASDARGGELTPEKSSCPETFHKIARPPRVPASFIFNLWVQRM
jgi:hypothetical protein